MKKYDKQTKHNLLLEQIKETLNDMHVGDRLLSVQQLLKQYSVGRAILDAVLNELAETNLIKRIPNVGTFCNVQNSCKKKIITLITPGFATAEVHPAYTALANAVKLDNRFQFRIVTLQGAYYEQLSDSLGDILILRIPSAEINISQLQKIKKLKVTTIFIGQSSYNFGLHFTDTKPGFGGFLAADCLLNHGHKELAVLISEPKVSEIKARVSEFVSCATYKNANVQVIDCNTKTNHSCLTTAYDTLAEYLKNHGCNFTALFVVSDVSALGALRALHEAGIRVPEDVSVIGYDGIPQGAYYSPPLSTISEDFEEHAKKLVEAIGDFFENKIKLIRIEVPPKLLLRKSIIQKIHKGT